jgi:hypothetical protein
LALQIEKAKIIQKIGKKERKALDKLGFRCYNHSIIYKGYDEDGRGKKLPESR